MWISIRTKRCRLSPRMRSRIESHLLRTFRREARHIGSVVVTVSPVALDADPGYRCQLRIWSQDLGTIVVSDLGPTVRAATQQAAARARHALRRRLQKRLAKLRRVTRFPRWSWESASG